MHNQGRKFFLPVVLAVAWIFIFTVVGSAQTRTIKGKVTDDKDQPVADAQITIMGTDVVRSFTCKTDKKGEYLYLIGQQLATYRVVVHKAGFRPEAKENVKPQLGEPAEVDFKLTPGEDTKMAFEMSPKEMAEYKAKYEEQQQKKGKSSAEAPSAYRLGVQLTEEGKYDEAIIELNKALERNPDVPALHAALGNAYAKSGKNEEALAAYEKAISIDPNDADLYANAGITMNALGKTAEAQEAFKKAATLNPANASKNYYNLGVILMNSGKADAAADAFKQSIAADPTFDEPYYQLGMALSGKQDTIPAAIEALKKYIAIGKKPAQVDVAKQIIQALGGK